MRPTPDTRPEVPGMTLHRLLDALRSVRLRGGGWVTGAEVSR